MLEHEATRRALNLASEELNKEKLLLEATEKDLEDAKAKLLNVESSFSSLDKNYNENLVKLNELETIIGKYIYCLIFKKLIDF